LRTRIILEEKRTPRDLGRSGSPKNFGYKPISGMEKTTRGRNFWEVRGGGTWAEQKIGDFAIRKNGSNRPNSVKSFLSST